MSIFRPARKLRASVALTGAALFTVGLAVASPGVGLAATSDPGVGGDIVTQGSQAYWLYLTYDAQTVAVADASTSAGARIIQWDNDGGSEQKWFSAASTTPTGNLSAT